MDNYKKYYGVIAFCLFVVVSFFISYKIISPVLTGLQTVSSQIEQKNTEKSALHSKLVIVQSKIQKIKDAIVSSQKKIYSPTESALGNETLFFTLYNDVIEMLKANSIKVKAIKYTYNPETDAFVQFGKDVYFVCDLDLEVVSNYYHLGKFIEDLYKYNYYIRINNIEVNPYENDKKVLITNLSLRLYAHTQPEESDVSVNDDVDNIDKPLAPLKQKK